MKKALTILAWVMLVGGVVGDDYIVEHGTNAVRWIEMVADLQTTSNQIEAVYIIRTPSQYIDSMKEDNVLAEVIRKLAKSGEICKVLGHNWRAGRPGEGDGFIFADYHPNTTYRTCRICGKCESCSVNAWK